MSKINFGLIGLAGYIAPRHLKAIKETNNELIAATDPNDSVGIIDSYFPNCKYFKEFERFDRYIEKERINSKLILDYISICSPNYLHDAHIRFALRSGSNAICEKPIVLNPWNIDALEEAENFYQKKIFTVLQLRLHPSIIELKKIVESSPDKIYNIDLTYITSRGNWYEYSWKGDHTKSGGIESNIGVHFFDMLYYVFGECKLNKLKYSDKKTSSGYLEFEKARVRWFLSIDENTLPANFNHSGAHKTYRSITIDNKELEFSNGFTDLHTLIYKDILSGNGFRVSENRTAIKIVSDLRNQSPEGLLGDFHPFLMNIK